MAAIAGVITLNLTINNFSSLSLSSTDSLICYGDSVQLIASGAQNIAGKLVIIYLLIVFQPLVYPLIDTSYVLTATDSLGCFSNDTILISVIPPYLLDLEELLILVLDLREYSKLLY